ncbi:UL36 very large tegument protein [Streptomyces sp. NPDC098789]|uniref:UL36 very large tegument protein n=1 Tax=Streptomyces sp. NPDC098789 TaxID=3366098 RepID=UPI00381C6154
MSSTAITQLAAHLRVLTGSLDPGAGWYGEFLRRDPDGMRACLDGDAIPPWDVVESLLQDLVELAGAQYAAERAGHAARLRAAAVLAHDRQPGGEAELRVLLAAAGAQRGISEAAVHDLTARLPGAADPAAAAGLARELSWTRDDLARAASRCADLADRLTALTPPLPAVPRQRPPVVRPAAEPAAAPVAGSVAGSVAAAPAPGGRGRARRPRSSGGARFAGAAPQDAAAAAVAAPPGLADAPDALHPTAPSGARFGYPAAGGLPGTEGAGRPGTEAGAPGGAGAPEAGRGAAEPGTGAGTGTPVLVAELIELRGRGRTGEAHALLCEAARWDAALLAGLARELERAGLGADWATLLWEAASLPPDRLAALAAALSDAGRTADCERLLRQGAARPAPEIAEAALALGAAGRSREADALLTAFVRVRTAEEAAALARRDPRWFAPRLLAAARGLAGSAHRDLVRAFRVAKIAPTG